MILIYILEFFPGKKFTFWNFSQGKSLHFGIFPGKKFTFWNFSQGKSLHFGIFPREKVYILEFFPGKKFTFWNFPREKVYILEFFPGKKFTFWNFFPGKNNFDLHFGIFPEILKLFPGKRKRKVPKCKLFLLYKLELSLFQAGKDFSRPNSGDKKMKFYILELFLNSGEDFQNIFHFKNFFF